MNLDLSNLNPSWRQRWRRRFCFPLIPSFSSFSFYCISQISANVFFSMPSNLGLQVKTEMSLLFCCGFLNLLGYFCLYICWFHLSSVFVDFIWYKLELLHWTRVCWTRDVSLLNSLKMVLTNKIVSKIVLFCKNIPFNSL